jgi:hypothetical protein
MPSQSKSTPPQKRKRRDWKSIIYIIFGLVMAAMFILTAILRY